MPKFKLFLLLASVPLAIASNQAQAAAENFGYNTQGQMIVIGSHQMRYAPEGTLAQADNLKFVGSSEIQGNIVSTRFGGVIVRSDGTYNTTFSDGHNTPKTSKARTYSDPYGNHKPIDLGIHNDIQVFGGGYSLFGATYMGARWYFPELRRFGEEDSFNVPNRYNLDSGNPIMNWDPSGHLSDRQVAMAGNSVAFAVGVMAMFFSGGTSELLFSFLGALSSSGGMVGLEQNSNGWNTASAAMGIFALASDVTSLAITGLAKSAVKTSTVVNESVNESVNEPAMFKSFVMDDNASVISHFSEKEQILNDQDDFRNGLGYFTGDVNNLQFKRYDAPKLKPKPPSVLSEKPVNIKQHEIDRGRSNFKVISEPTDIESTPEVGKIYPDGEYDPNDPGNQQMFTHLHQGLLADYGESDLKAFAMEESKHFAPDPIKTFTYGKEEPAFNMTYYVGNDGKINSISMVSHKRYNLLHGARAGAREGKLHRTSLLWQEITIDRNLNIKYIVRNETYYM